MVNISIRFEISFKERNFKMFLAKINQPSGILKKMNSMGVANNMLQNHQNAVSGSNSPSVVVMKSMSNLRFEMDEAYENQKQINGGHAMMPSVVTVTSLGGRKMQPSMGVTAASIKSKRNIRDFEHQQQQSNDDNR